jgi:hypothetical protein
MYKDLPVIALEDILSRNACCVGNVDNSDDINLLKFSCDKKLAQVFPIIGFGSEALVFDIGNGLVLKRRVCDGRTWEFDLFKLAAKTPGLFSEQIEVAQNYSTFGDYVFQVQKKLTIIHNLEPFDEIINKLYGISKVAYKYWEWGVDSAGVPHVFDWA